MSCDIYTDHLRPPPSKRIRLDASEPSASGASIAGPSSSSGLDTKLSEWKSIKYCTRLSWWHQALIISDLNSDHFKVAQYLQNLDEDHVSTVGGALGLSYSKLRKMTKYPDDMVAAWLRREDFVMNMSGKPTYIEDLVWRAWARLMEDSGAGIQESRTKRNCYRYWGERK